MSAFHLICWSKCAFFHFFIFFAWFSKVLEQSSVVIQHLVINNLGVFSSFKPQNEAKKEETVAKKCVIANFNHGKMGEVPVLC